MIDPLRTELCSLAQALHPHQIRLIVGGGYGLLLRTEQLRKLGLQTRFANPPGARSTSDLDLFLSTEVISDATKVIKLRDALQGLGYAPIETAKFYQFVKPVPYAGFLRGVKIDLLAAPVPDHLQGQVKMDERRIRPRGSSRLHAHTTPEALTIEEHLLTIDLGPLDSPILLYLPHPYSYLLLKLFAFRDQIEVSEKKYGAHHAFDIYRIIAFMTAEEWQTASVLRERNRQIGLVKEAGGIVGKLFATVESPGVLRLRAHARSIGEILPLENLRDLIGDLRELFPSA